MSALNFVLPHSLGGGGIASLRFDPQVALHTAARPLCAPPLRSCCDVLSVSVLSLQFQSHDVLRFLVGFVLL